MRVLGFSKKWSKLDKKWGTYARIEITDVEVTAMGDAFPCYIRSGEIKQIQV